MQVRVVENVLKLNDEVAAMNRTALDEAGVFAIDLIGGPGCGKTTLLEATLQKLSSQMNIAVLVGDLTTQRDADRMAKYCDNVVQINTGRGCHLESHQIRQGIEQMNIEQMDLLIIENVGNLICPVGFDLGQDTKVAMFSLTEGDDKPAKHPYLVNAAELILLNKIDLATHVPFNRQVFDKDVARLNESAPVLSMSVQTGEGLDAWLQWLRDKANTKRHKTA